MENLERDVSWIPKGKAGRWYTRGLITHPELQQVLGKEMAALQRLGQDFYKVLFQSGLLDRNAHLRQRLTACWWLVQDADTLLDNGETERVLQYLRETRSVLNVILNNSAVKNRNKGMAQLLFVCRGIVNTVTNSLLEQESADA